jgi:CRP-like cAMP-binding protein
MDIAHILNNIAPLSIASIALLSEEAILLHLPKGTLVLKADKIEHYLYFIQKGIVRAFSDHNEDIITFWFGQEGDVILSMNNYVNNQKSYENIELLENCVLYKISIQYLQKLYYSHIDIANWGRKLIERELLKTENRMISREVLTAKQRYQELLQFQPELLQRVPLKYIASYLGITPVSLSRIRKGR